MVVKICSMSFLLLDCSCERSYERYAKNRQAQLSCFDRIILFGIFGNIAYPDAMAWQLKQADCKLIDYTKNKQKKVTERPG